MSIQGNINNLLTLTGVAAAVNPQMQEKFKTAAEAKKLEKQQQVILESTAEQSKQPENKGKAGEVLAPNISQLASTTAQLAEIRKKQFELNPTKESYQAYMEDKQRSEAMGRVANVMDLANKQIQANRRSEEIIKAKNEQRKNYRSFKTALYAHPDVAPLGEAAKKQIYEQTKNNKTFRQEVLNKYYGNTKPTNK